MADEELFTISQAAERVGVSTKTIIRWEKANRIAPARRNWRGWRVFTGEQVEKMLRLRMRLY